ncbi:hypothetical protein POJ06DRAFT_1515 [Lipomyces tetrasporus]|uniref:threonine--tRNA ligase n=1 Tax=Lipomyces tetrasporus TaxID=54092 RepID=A0AAD7QXY3_9ASCO|nr:uncharacterized protein POJ06DRAFT_1515 [Lipomyces tetrasporus]KAJ8103468.1 hypothetical protein POJ06DRAFT_1515 [Lipomyces tetrasporus]
MRPLLLRSAKFACLGFQSRQWRLSTRLCSSLSNPSAADGEDTGDVFLDHRQIGAQQELYMISPLTPGSVFLLPHGTRIYNRLLTFMRAQLKVFGFEEVVSPIIYRRSLWETSGHWEKYKEDMFEVGGRNEETKEEYGLKPMNCPGHCLIYGVAERSYRDLPIRYADFSPLHRNEASGALTGLTRVRRFHQDDGHIFCRPDQVQAEIKASLKLVDNVYKVFKIPSYRLLLSTRPEQYIGKVEEWDKAESDLRDALEESGQDWQINDGDGAFYGPKIDILIKDSNGKEHQAATIQLDFQLPQRFELAYRGEDDTLDHRPVMVHRAVFGSVERFMAVIIEQLQGRWPLWISPRQAVIVPIADRHVEYARKVQEELSGVPGGDKGDLLDFNASTFYVDVDERSSTLGHRLREAIKKGYNYIGVVGDKEMSDGTVALRQRTGKPTVMKIEDVRQKFIDSAARYE